MSKLGWISQMDEKEVNITDAGNSEGTSKKLRFKTKYARIGFVSFVVIASSIVFYFCLFENRTLFGFLRSILFNLFGIFTHSEF